MMNKINNWLDAPLTFRRELKMSAAVMTIYAVAIGGGIIANRVKEKLEEKKTNRSDITDEIDN